MCIDVRFILPSVIFKGKNCINKFITWVLKKYKWSQEIIKFHFNKDLVMTNEDEEIYDKCNINLRLPKKLPVNFHNLQGYEGHIIFKELNNFDVDIDVIPKGIDKYMSIIVNRHITFIDSLQFYNSSLDTLASNLNDEDFKYLVSEYLNTHLYLRKNTFIHH